MLKIIANFYNVFFSLFGRNWLTLIGSLTATISAFMIIFFIILGITGYEVTPYIGIMAFLLMPIFFIFGIIILLIGVYIDNKNRKYLSEMDKKESPYPTINLNDKHTRKMFSLSISILIATFFVLSITIYHSIHFMDTVTFCGKVCHTVMEPEYISYTNSPHARVKCVECHIGPGADWFVKSKISGVRQVFATMLKTYHRPTPSPVENLRPSRDTCEECHWPEHFSGSQLKIITRYGKDKNNTPRKTILNIHIGGGPLENGIHSWHIDKAKNTTYIPMDKKRQNIGWVKVISKGKEVIYKTPDFDEKNIDIARAEKRLMDCIDCHNRPTHIFNSPSGAIDNALFLNKIDNSLPYIKKIGTETLENLDIKDRNALNNISENIKNFYKENYPEVYNNKSVIISNAIKVLQEIYKKNNFPEMNVTWNTYTNNIGHYQFPGCFRCHDGNHIAEDGSKISSDCNTCHKIIVMDEVKPEILNIFK
jgi:uncharacterized membrane protein